VGFELYTELLEEAIQELRAKADPEAVDTISQTKHKDPEIRTPYTALLPESYVPDTHQRLSLYRRLSGATDEAELQSLEKELMDRFGDLPEPSKNLLWVIRIKQTLRKYGISGITVGPDRITLNPGEGSRLEPPRAIALIASKPHDYQLHPDSRFSAKIPTGNPAELLTRLEALLERLISPVLPSSI
jgi:transcription-repair coupling factor (superfamily II helicase)